ncbi:hypothetical protein FS749_013551 [Ceratobasidium sp. UAMH 11750]|nr:hypothetical protein FS749_013551 [Ceratobasidium sp. UAMH 11750]
MFSHYFILFSLLQLLLPVNSQRRVDSDPGEIYAKKNVSSWYRDGYYDGPSDFMNTAEKAILGLAIGGISILIISWIMVFYYLQKHGRTLATLIQQQQLNAVTHHHSHVGLEMYGPLNPATQQPGSYNHYNGQTCNSQRPRKPEPVHSAGSHAGQNNYNPPSYSSPTLL